MLKLVLQYTLTEGFDSLLKISKYSIIASMSEPGTPYDNVIMESLKTEMLDNKNG